MIGDFLDLLEGIIDIIDTVLDLLGKAFFAFITSDFIPTPFPVPGKFSVFDTIAKGFAIIYSIFDKIKYSPRKGPSITLKTGIKSFSSFLRFFLDLLPLNSSKTFRLISVFSSRDICFFSLISI